MIDDSRFGYLNPIRHDPDYSVMERDINLETNTLIIPLSLYCALLFGAQQCKISDPAEYLEQLVDREICTAARHERHWNRSDDLF
jgi:hypothetical protein